MICVVGMQQGYVGQSTYNQYPGPGPGTSPEQFQNYPANSGYPPATRAVYPQYAGPEADRYGIYIFIHNN